MCIDGFNVFLEAWIDHIAFVEHAFIASGQYQKSVQLEYGTLGLRCFNYIVFELR